MPWGQREGEGDSVGLVREVGMAAHSPGSR